MLSRKRVLAAASMVCIVSSFQPQQSLQRNVNHQRYYSYSTSRQAAHAKSASTAARADTIDESSTVRRNVTSLKDWAEEAGVQNALDLFETCAEESCWGVTMPRAADKGTTVLQVPAEMILSSKRIEDEYLANTKTAASIQPAIDFLRTSKFVSQTPQFFLFLKVLKEYQQGPESPWYTWLESLPRSFDTSVCMTDLELDCLPPFAWSLANVEKLHLESFSEALSMLQGDFLSKDIVNNSKLLQWAFNVVFTRCWRYPEETDNDTKEERCDIVPLGDMFNHNKDMNIRLTYDEQDNCVISLADLVEAGTVLHLNYGRPSNAYRFLVMFGFVDETMPELMCQVKAANPSQRHVDMGYDFDKMIFRVEDGAISNQVWDVILYCILEQAPKVQELLYQAHRQGDYQTKAALHQKFHLESCLTLRKHVEGTLNEMNDLLVKIDQHLDGKANVCEEHPRLEMIRRNNVFVQKTFQKVKRRLDDMVLQEEDARRAEGKEEESQRNNTGNK